MPWETTENQIRHRLKDPGQFGKETFRIKELPNGVQLVLGKSKGTGKWETQAVHFPKDKFTIEQAKAWVEGHDFSQHDALPTVNLRGVEIFAAGTWKDSLGREETYSEQDLDAMVGAFEESKGSFRPFLKIGHLEKSRYSDSPAFGWVTALRRAGKKLLADFSHVPAKLGQLIISGAFPNRSAEILKTPQLGGKTWPWALKAVALLGAQHPALDSLGAITELYQAPEGDAYGFTSHEGEAPHLTFEAVTGSEPPASAATKGDTAMSDEKIKTLEGDLEKERAARAAAEKKAADTEAKLHAQAEEQRQSEIRQRAATGKAALERAFAAGKMAPVLRPHMERLIDIIAKDGAVVSFSAKEGDKPTEMTAMAVLEAMFEAAPSGLNFGASFQAKTEGGSAGTAGNERPDQTLDKRAREYMRAHSGTSYQAAVAEVLKESPELQASWGAPPA